MAVAHTLLVVVFALLTQEVTYHEFRGSISTSVTLRQCSAAWSGVSRRSVMPCPYNRPPPPPPGARLRAPSCHAGWAPFRRLHLSLASQTAQVDRRFITPSKGPVQRTCRWERLRRSALTASWRSLRRRAIRTDDGRSAPVRGPPTEGDRYARDDRVAPLGSTHAVGVLLLAQRRLRRNHSTRKRRGRPTVILRLE